MDFKNIITKKRAVGIVIVVLIAAAVLGYAYHLNGDSLDFGNSSSHLIVTDSMDAEDQPYDIKSIPLYSLVVVKHLDPDEMGRIEVGDVIAFHYQGRLTVHRVAEIVTDGSGNLTGFRTVGDVYAANPTGHYETPVLADVSGIVVGVAPWLGQAIHAIQDSPVYLFLIIIVLIIMFSAISDILKLRKDEPQETGSEGDSEVSSDSEVSPDISEPPPAESDLPAEDRVADGADTEKEEPAEGQSSKQHDGSD